MGAFILFCNGNFEEKVKFLFTLYDYDYNGKLDKNELIVTFLSCIRGFCKIICITCPSTKEIEEIASDCFYFMDKDFNKVVDSDEFIQWAKVNYDL